MNPLIQQIIDQIISKKAFINDYPKPGVIFLTIDPLFNDPAVRKMLSKAVNSAVAPQSFDDVASIASRGYLFSEMIANEFGKGEYLVQKVKSMGDSHYVQSATTTEYSSDALQVLKETIQKGKKYLLTDDLIATGGSVMTAINLIRSCGGEVDSVFVMTELTDFNAREQLKKEGIELISLLKFSQKDLQKLLVLQKSYAETKTVTPITYHLDHHVKGEKALIEANKEAALTVHLASHSLLKKEATQLAFQGVFDPLETKVIAHNSQSGVSAQPFDYSETVQGATNRLKSLEEDTKTLEQPVLVSIENGIRYSEEEQCYYDFVHVMVKKGELVYRQTQDCCAIPEEVMNAIHKNEQQGFAETWGEAAKRIGLAHQADNPHQEQIFGGISRTDHLFKALCKALGKLKVKMMENHPIEIEDQHFNLNRLVDLNSKKLNNKYAKRGIFFTPSSEAINSKPINFYNHGCPVEQWKIDPEKVARNSFQVFTTGDAFSVMSPDIELAGANINIHVGLEHAKYSPLVLLQEALQLCRCAYEHGARSVTISLPDTFHPVAHYSDFNSLLLSLFKASGANKVYYYDKSYIGKLDETNLKSIIPITLSNQADEEHYRLDRKDLCNYLHQANDVQKSVADASLDQQIMHFSRERHFKRAWSKFDPKHTDIMGALSDKKSLSEINVPEIKVQPHVLLCCAANKPLAEKIAASLRMRGEMVRLYHIEGEGEHAKIPEDAVICGSVVTIVQSTRPNPEYIEKSREYQKNGASSYFFEAALIARQAHLRGAETINLINPYQFNARSDKAEDNFKGKTGAYVQQNGMLLAAAGVNQVITAECHDNHTMSGAYTGKKIKGAAVSAISTITARLADEWINNPEHPLQGQIRLVTPDAGAAKRTKELTELLQAILGNKLCQTRVLGEKQRASHKDDSALISSLNSGSVGINPQDKYLITDDETATGTTLCQAVEGLSKNGAKDISVVVVHNNMPIDWLSRQLCLARFFLLGVNDLHFSDTHEMGRLAKNYEDLIAYYAQQAKLTPTKVEAQVVAWFKKNVTESFSDKSDEHIKVEFTRFKSMFQHLEAKVRVHSLANEFANKVTTKPYMVNPHSFEYKVNEFSSKIQESQAKCIVAFAGASLPAASAAAIELGLPLHIIPQTVAGCEQQKITLPNSTFALIGTPSEATLKTMKENTGYCVQDPEDDLVIVANKDDGDNKPSPVQLKASMSQSLAAIQDIYNKIKCDPRLKDRPVKLLGVGIEGQVVAGQLSHLLNQNGSLIGIASVDNHADLHTNSVVYTGNSGEEKLSVDRNSLGMGDVCIAVASDFGRESKKAINNLASIAKVHCPYYLSVSPQGQCCVASEDGEKAQNQGFYTTSPGMLLFSQKVQQQQLVDQRMQFSL